MTADNRMPAVFQFPYIVYDIAQPTSWTYDVPLVAFGLDCMTTDTPDQVLDYTIVAHANVKAPGSASTVSAYATTDPLRVPGNSNNNQNDWWDLFVVSTSCQCAESAATTAPATTTAAPEPPPLSSSSVALAPEEEVECKSTWAYHAADQGNPSMCFSEIGFPGIPGWTSGALPASSSKYTFTLYALDDDDIGCDPTGLVSVGVVSIVYNGVMGVALIQLTGDYYLLSEQFHFGLDRLPVDENGKESVALEVQSTANFKVGQQVHKIMMDARDLDRQPLHIAAQATVCGPFPQASTRKRGRGLAQKWLGGGEGLAPGPQKNESPGLRGNRD